MTCAIKTSFIKDIIKEQILYFNKELNCVIWKDNIYLKNIYNVNETGFQ